MEGRSNQFVTFIRTKAILESNGILMAAAVPLAYILRRLPEPGPEEVEAIRVIKEALLTQKFEAFTIEVLDVLKKALASVDDDQVKEAFANLKKFIDKKHVLEEQDGDVLTDLTEDFKKIQPRPFDNKSGVLVLLPEEDRDDFTEGWKAKLAILSAILNNITLPITNLNEVLLEIKEKLQTMIIDDIELVRTAIADEGILDEKLEKELQKNLEFFGVSYVFHLFTDVGMCPDNMHKWDKNGMFEFTRILCDCLFQDDIYAEFWRKLKEILLGKISNLRALEKFRGLLGTELADDLYVAAAKEIKIAKLTSYLNILLGMKEPQHKAIIKRVLHELCDRIVEDKLTNGKLHQYVNALKEAARTDSNISKDKQLCADLANRIKQAKKENARNVKKTKKQKKQKIKQKEKKKKTQGKLDRKEIRNVVENWSKQPGKYRSSVELHVDDEKLHVPSLKLGEKVERVNPEVTRSGVFTIFSRKNYASGILSPRKKTACHPEKPVNSDPEKHKRLHFFGNDKPGHSRSSEGSMIRDKGPRPSDLGGSRIRSKTPRQNPRSVYGNSSGKPISASDTALLRVIKRPN